MASNNTNNLQIWNLTHHVDQFISDPSSAFTYLPTHCIQKWLILLRIVLDNGSWYHCWLVPRCSDQVTTLAPGSVLPSATSRTNPLRRLLMRKYFPVNSSGMLQKKKLTVMSWKETVKETFLVTLYLLRLYSAVHYRPHNVFILSVYPVCQNRITF